MERHGPHQVFLPTAQRAALVRAALASSSEVERAAGRAMMRRWGLTADGERVPWPRARPSRGWLERLPAARGVARYAEVLRVRDGGGESRDGGGGERSERSGLSALSALSVFRGAGEELADLVRAGHAERLRELACRFAELAHAISRTSYWMVRDGAPGADQPARPARPLERIWSGKPTHIASQIEFWAAAAAAAAMHERERHPAQAAIAALLALEAAVGTASGVWWTPAAGWLAAVAHADVAQDADADVDPTISPDPDLDEPAARAALADLVRGEALLEAGDAATAAPMLEAALASARAASAPVLALRAHYRWLAALQAAGDDARFTAEAERLLRELPSPVALFPLSVGGGLAVDALAWTANWLAWNAHLRGDHARCLEVIERALLFARPTSWYDHVRDTKIRALLAAGRADDAYALVHEVLARDPACEPLADLAAAPAYLAWRDEHRPPTSA